MSNPNVFTIPESVSKPLVALELLEEKMDGKRLSAEAVALLVEAAQGATSPELAAIVTNTVISYPITAKDETAVCKALADATGRDLAEIKTGVKDARKQAKLENKGDHIDAGVITGDMKQSQIALILAEKLADVCRWEDLSKRWYLKSGNVWKPAGAIVVLKRIKAVLDRAMRDDGYNASVLSGVESLLKIDLQAESWTESRHLLPMENGVLNLRTKTLEPYGDRAFVWQLPYAYDPAATCPTVKRYLVTATGSDRSVIRLLLAWMWAVLHGRSDLQKYLELVGPGGTGKSTFLALCALLVGKENQYVTDLKTLEKNQFEAANLKDKRLVQITDSSRFGGEVAMLKAITGGDPLRYERKNVQADEPFVFPGLVMIAANEAILSSDYTSGLSRRKVPVTLKQMVTEGDKARYRKRGGIIKVMGDQMPGLVNWLLSLDESKALDIINNPTGEVARQKLESELGVNPILRWLEERVTQCVAGQEEDFIGKADQEQQYFLFPNYVEWCKGEGHKPFAITRFSALVVDNCKAWGIHTEKKGGVRFDSRPGKQGAIIAGLRLRTAADDGKKGLISAQYVGCDEVNPFCDEVKPFCDEVKNSQSYNNHIVTNICDECDKGISKNPPLPKVIECLNDHF